MQISEPPWIILTLPQLSQTNLWVSNLTSAVSSATVLSWSHYPSPGPNSFWCPLLFLLWPILHIILSLNHKPSPLSLCLKLSSRVPHYWYSTHNEPFLLFYLPALTSLLLGHIKPSVVVRQIQEPFPTPNTCYMPLTYFQRLFLCSGYSSPATYISFSGETLLSFKVQFKHCLF